MSIQIDNMFCYYLNIQQKFTNTSEKSLEFQYVIPTTFFHQTGSLTSFVVESADGSVLVKAVLMEKKTAHERYNTVF